MSNKYTNEYIIGTIQEVAELSALEISKNYALDRLAENGVVTQEEVSSMYSLAQKVLFEGSEDFIPETLELPEDDGMDDDGMGDDGMGDEDLDVSQLEGIVLPDAEGNQYVVQNGMIIPYGDDTDGDGDIGGDTDNDGDMGAGAPVADPAAGAPVVADDAGAPVVDPADAGAPVNTDPTAATDAPAGDTDPEGVKDPETSDEDDDENKDKKPVQESTEVNSDTSVITESDTFVGFTGNSAIVQKLIDDIKFR